MMHANRKALMMRIYTDELAKADGLALFTGIVERTCKGSLAGSTVLRASHPRPFRFCLWLSNSSTMTIKSGRFVPRQFAGRRYAGVGDHRA